MNNELDEHEAALTSGEPKPINDGPVLLGIMALVAVLGYVVMRIYGGGVMEYQTVAERQAFRRYGIMQNVAHNPPSIKYPPLVKKPTHSFLRDLSFVVVSVVMAVTITMALS